MNGSEAHGFNLRGIMGNTPPPFGMIAIDQIGQMMLYVLYCGGIFTGHQVAHANKLVSVFPIFTFWLLVFIRQVTVADHRVSEW